MEAVSGWRLAVSKRTVVSAPLVDLFRARVTPGMHITRLTNR